jgi:two-component system OmpR family response regulator
MSVGRADPDPTFPSSLLGMESGRSRALGPRVRGPARAGAGAGLSTRGRGPDGHRVVRAQDVVVDLDGFLAWVGTRRLILPRKQFLLLTALVEAAGRVLERKELERVLWGAAPPPHKGLDVHVRRLRRSIEDDPRRPRYIRTVRGIGYIFDSAGMGEC